MPSVMRLRRRGEEALSATSAGKKPQQPTENRAPTGVEKSREMRGKWNHPNQKAIRESLGDTVDAHAPGHACTTVRREHQARTHVRTSEESTRRLCAHPAAEITFLYLQIITMAAAVTISFNRDTCSFQYTISTTPGFL